ncbi:MAG: hypothetical protein JJU03_01245 [Idiomarina sp.]|nr:hypothetical protein [Idiomarina sp.]
MPRSRTFKIFHTFYLLVIAVLLTLIFVERQKQSDDPSTRALSEQLESTQESLTTRVRDLSEQMDSRFAALEERLPPPHEQDQPRRTAPPASSQNPPVDSIHEPQESADEPAQPPMSSGDYARLGSAMVDDFEARKNEFDMQSVDPDWANPTLDLIRAQFSDNHYLSELHLADMECRSSICQIDIDTAEPEAINPARLLQGLNGMNDNDQGLVYRLMSRPLDTTYRVLVLRSSEPERDSDSEPEN